MNNLWLKIKVWTKITLFGVGLLYLLFFVYNNTGGDRQVYFWWWFNQVPQTSAFVLALLSFIAGVLATLLVRTTWMTYRQIQGMQNRSRSNRLEREVADMKLKAAMLQTRTATTSASGPLPEAGEGSRPL